ncbi:hypothetical protein NPIL_469621 [Nephila pilipes]|uniref:Uncharacterized protein n=1 Tax=Nephila pilipes TaxID=299642 RepID=A0A8X6NFE9_NEPPI|nr:hypothetical protein NPIL_469621 [Nephila pilipes]
MKLLDNSTNEMRDQSKFVWYGNNKPNGERTESGFPKCNYLEKEGGIESWKKLVRIVISRLFGFPNAMMRYCSPTNSKGKKKELLFGLDRSDR